MTKQIGNNVNSSISEVVNEAVLPGSEIGRQQIVLTAKIEIIRVQFEIYKHGALLQAKKDNIN